MDDNFNAVLTYLSEQKGYSHYGSILVYCQPHGKRIENLNEVLNAFEELRILDIKPDQKGNKTYLLKQSTKREIAKLPKAFNGRPYDFLLDEETKKQKREEYMKKNAYWRAKYWWLIATIGFVAGSIITPIALEEWKTRRQEQSKPKATTKTEERSDTTQHK